MVFSSPRHLMVAGGCIIVMEKVYGMDFSLPGFLICCLILGFGMCVKFFYFSIVAGFYHYDHYCDQHYLHLYNYLNICHQFYTHEAFSGLKQCHPFLLFILLINVLSYSVTIPIMKYFLLFIFWYGA